MFDNTTMKKIGMIGRHELWVDGKDNMLLFCYSPSSSGAVSVSQNSLKEFYKRTDHKGNKVVHVENPHAERHVGKRLLSDFLTVRREWIKGKDGEPYCLVNPANMEEIVVPVPKLIPSASEDDTKPSRTLRRELTLLLDEARGFGSERTYAMNDFRKNVGRQPNPKTLYVIFTNSYGPKGAGFYCGEVE